MNIIDWIKESNRYKHLVGIALVTMVTLVMLFLLYGAITWQHFIIATFVALGVAFAMEFKDVHHANVDHVPFKYWDWSAWDWNDCLAGMIGCDIVLLLWVVVFVIFNCL